MTAPLALTMGEPAGIGGEIALMAWQKRGQSALPPFFVIDNPSRLERLATRLGLSVPLRPIAQPGETSRLFATSLPVLPIELAKPSQPGHPDPANAPAVIEAITKAVALVRSGRTADPARAQSWQPLVDGVRLHAHDGSPDYCPYSKPSSQT